MIASIKGIVTFVGTESVVVEAGGVGYEVILPEPQIAKMKTDRPAAFWTHEHLREDSRELYGFAAPEDLALFRKFISISGVGPRSAIKLMGLGRTAEIKKAIMAGDVTYLTRAPGVGKKSAQKIILELKGTIEDADTPRAGGDEVVEALVGLGYSRSEALATVQALPKDLSETEERIRAALKSLRKK